MYSTLSGTVGNVVQNSIELIKGAESGPWVDG